MTPASDPTPHVGRVFIVGCPRSGTTLLQAMLGQHSEVFTFPESHFFTKVSGRFETPGPLGLVSPRAAAQAYRQLAELVEAPDAIRRPPRLPRYPLHARAFRELVDASTTARGKRVWIEKSPPHLHRVDEILHAIPDARFLHLVRDGRDVVASFYRLCLEDPERWVPQVLGRKTAHMVDSVGGRDTVLRAVIDRWNGDVRRSRELSRLPAHRLLTYEQLVQDPSVALGEICDWIGIEWEDAMLRHWEAAEQVVGFRAEATHMQRPFQPLEPTPLRAFHDVFTPEEQAKVTRGLDNGGRLGP